MSVRFGRSALLMLLVVAKLAASAAAQDFRIYTTVTDLNQGSKSKAGTSLTLFHGGKVYDYIESTDETVIHDPVHNRFLVLSNRHKLTTEITQDEVRRFLGLAQTHARELLLDWQKDAVKRKTAVAALEFQMLPEFEVREDTKAKTLTLDSPVIRYDVTYADPPSADTAQTYLRAADRTAQLNSVLNPHAFLPEPRLRLNEELRQRGVLPVEVVLEIKGERPARLKATHEWTWKLRPIDRKIIDDREMQLRRDDFEITPFVEFQQLTLAAANRKR